MKLVTVNEVTSRQEQVMNNIDRELESAICCRAKFCIVQFVSIKDHFEVHILAVKTFMGNSSKDMCHFTQNPKTHFSDSAKYLKLWL